MQDWEGLAHLAEHVTLASAAGVRLTEWVDEREGEVRDYPRIPENTRDHPRSPEITREWVDEREGEVRGVRSKRRPNGSQRGYAHTPHKVRPTAGTLDWWWRRYGRTLGRAVAARMAFSRLVDGVPCVRAGERLHGGGEDDLHLSAGQATS